MRLRKRHWTGAFVLSLAAHAGAAALLMQGDGDEVRIAGGEQFEIALLGNAFEDASSAGTENGAMEPAIRPSPAAAEPLQPVEQPVAPVPTAVTALPAQPDVTQPVLPDEVAATPPETLKTTEATESATIDPRSADEVEVEQTIAALVNVPVPTARPFETPQVIQPAERRPADVQPARGEEAARATVETPRAEGKRRQQPKALQAAGNGGNSRADARRGQADGADRGRQAATGSAGPGREAGNAAVSNYPGKIVSKLRRSLRYPPAARRDRLRGEVHVAFTVTGGGGVAGARVVRSSGYPMLDEAALETVRRAAPFPPIPDGRADWSFTVPLAFTR